MHDPEEGSYVDWQGMNKCHMLEESHHSRCKCKQQGANAQRGIPDPGSAQVGCLTVHRIGNHAHPASRWQLPNRNIKAGSSSTTGEGRGRNHEENDDVSHTKDLLCFAIRLSC